MHGSTEPGVGPNAVTRLAEALSARAPDALASVFAGHAGWLDVPPEAMVFEGDVAALHAALWRVLPREEAAKVAHAAGRLTADYVLAHRIPAAARAVLRMLPAAASAPLLGRAVAAHAWTFAGSGRVRVRNGRPLVVEIAANPLAVAPGCPWHRGVFERLFATLVHPGAFVSERACCAEGASACRFEIDWTTAGAGVASSRPASLPARGSA
jgi:divinyl protochlorophyllide a 8-vinyl-reductase